MTELISFTTPQPEHLEVGRTYLIQTIGDDGTRPLAAKVMAIHLADDKAMNPAKVELEVVRFVSHYAPEAPSKLTVTMANHRWVTPDESYVHFKDPSPNEASSMAEFTTRAYAVKVEAAEARAIERPAAKPAPLAKACFCGCGGQTKGGNFVAGHDMTAKGAIKKAMKGENTWDGIPILVRENFTVLGFVMTNPEMLAFMQNGGKKAAKAKG